LLEGRVQRLEAVLSARLRGVTVVLEQVEDEGNLSAVLRSCEAFGVQEIHVLEHPKAPFRLVVDITQGCHRWLDLHRYREAGLCFDGLTARGYRLYGSYLGEGAVPLESLDFTTPAALVFGNEKVGISEETRARCEATFRIPMYGMTQSFNISVAAALALSHATRARRAAVGRPGDLSEEDRAELRDRWYRAEVRDAERVLQELRRRR
jgi:tRNA (guanosine-2'-O-)-methyltransferase